MSKIDSVICVNNVWVFDTNFRFEDFLHTDVFLLCLIFVEYVSRLENNVNQNMQIVIIKDGCEFRRKSFVTGATVGVVPMSELLNSIMGLAPAFNSDILEKYGVYASRNYKQKDKAALPLVHNMEFEYMIPFFVKQDEPFINPTREYVMGTLVDVVTLEPLSVKKQPQGKTFEMIYDNFRCYEIGNYLGYEQT